MVRLTDRPDMALDVYRGRITTNQQSKPINEIDLTNSAKIKSLPNKPRNSPKLTLMD